MDDFMSSLLCQENEKFLEAKVGDEEHSFIPLHEYGVSDDEYVSTLIEREKDLGFKKGEPMMFVHWIKHARMDAINWILQTTATLGFHFQTAYLSVTYLDRFLSRCSIDSDKYWAMQLLSVACLTLAAKMEECIVPVLSEFQLEDYCFEGKVIQRMELLVLSTLEWNMAIITPLAFLPYFITKFCNESPPSLILSKTTQLIFTLIKEFNLEDHRPSIIAAAAILAVLDQQLSIEALVLKMSSIPQYSFLEPKDIFGCYNQIRRFYIGKTRRNKLVHSPSPLPILSRPIVMIESPLVASAAMTKRRRLTFNDDKESCGEKGLQQEKSKFEFPEV